MSVTLAEVGETLPQDNRDASVRRWVVDVLAGSPLPMLAEPRERRAVADWLMADLDDRSRLVLEALDRRYDEGELTRLQGHLRKTLAGVPVQRVVGWAEFRGLRIGCSGAVLIPRPETEEVVGWFLEGMSTVVAGSGSHPLRVVDVGTGSGCMALSIKKERPHWDVVAIDLSGRALEQARSNADELGLTIEFLEKDALDVPALAALGPFHGIVSNPPYIPANEVLDPHVAGHEPHEALFVPESDPLLFYRALRDFAESSLVAGGCMVAECHREFTRDVADCWQLDGALTERLTDLQGAERAVRLVRS